MLNKWTVLILALWALMVYGLYRVYKAFKDAAHSAGEAVTGAVKGAADVLIIKPIQGGTVALANVMGVNEAGGYTSSEGQLDPTLRYNLARAAYAKAQGYTPGTDEWKNPPGFPDKATWLDNGGAVTRVDDFDIFGK